MHELPGMGPEILLVLLRQRVCALRVGVTFIIDLEPPAHRAVDGRKR